MDAKLTLSLNQEVIETGKKYAQERGISMSRLVEFLLRKVTSSSYQSLEDFPIADWVNQVAEGQAEYKIKSKPAADIKKEYYESKKK